MTVLAGCGGGDKKQTTTRTAPQDPNADLEIPSHVPRRAAGDADRAVGEGDRALAAHASARRRDRRRPLLGDRREVPERHAGPDDRHADREARHPEVAAVRREDQGGGGPEAVRRARVHAHAAPSAATAARASARPPAARSASRTARSSSGTGSRTTRSQDQPDVAVTEGGSSACVAPEEVEHPEHAVGARSRGPGPGASAPRCCNGRSPSGARPPRPRGSCRGRSASPARGRPPRPTSAPGRRPASRPMIAAPEPHADATAKPIDALAVVDRHAAQRAQLRRSRRRGPRRSRRGRPRGSSSRSTSVRRRTVMPRRAPATPRQAVARALCHEARARS